VDEEHVKAIVKLFFSFRHLEPHVAFYTSNITADSSRGKVIIITVLKEMFAWTYPSRQRLGGLLISAKLNIELNALRADLLRIKKPKNLCMIIQWALAFTIHFQSSNRIYSRGEII
jgi:hypothetical protein